MKQGIKQFIKHILGNIRCLIGGGVKHGKNTYIGRMVHFINPKNITLGNNVQVRPDVDIFAGDKGIIIGNNCDIGTRNRIVGNVIIEDNVLFGPDNYVSSADHTYENINIPIIHQGAHTPNKFGHDELKIGEGSWIGTHVAIIGAVHIGKHCVIGANSVVTTDIPDYSVAVGMPARVIKQYNFESNQWERIK